jgi:hypothetical protein
MSSTLHGAIIVKDGKVILLKNITDLKASVTGETLHSVLQTLSNAGWKLNGDYELVLSRIVEDE